MLKSTIPLYPDSVDSRCLQMEVSYYMLDKKQADNLAISFYNWCLLFMNNQCVDEWYWGQRRINHSSLPLRISKSTAYTFGLDANVISNVVYNKKTYKLNKQKLLTDISISQGDLVCSKDYHEFYERQFLSAPKSTSDWQEKILGFFNEKGRICRSPIATTDIHAFVSACPYQYKPTLFYGSIRFCVFLYCVSDNISATTEKMIAYLNEVSTAFVNINAFISLSPILSPSTCSPHMAYFGSNVIQDGTHIAVGVTASEWYKSYYLQGSEWFNIISPLAQQHLLNVSIEYPQHKNIAFKILKTGGLAVWIKKGITTTDIDDLVPMKHLLYPALYPGMMSIEKKHILTPEAFGLIAKPRKQWELIPIFQNEIIVTDNHVVFEHQQKIITPA